MIKIAPSILSADFSKLGEEIRSIEKAGADIIHIDVMDGDFVPNITFGPPVIKAIRKYTKLPFDVHLMISNPDRYIADFKEAGADIITVHVEACTHLHRTLQSIRSMGVKAGVALNPATDTESIRYVMDVADMVLVMTVNPGFGGQMLIEPVLQKIGKVRSIAKESGKAIDIEVDGGVNTENSIKVIQAGADIIVSGSAVFSSSDMKEAIQKIRDGVIK